MKARMLVVALAFAAPSAAAQDEAEPEAAMAPSDAQLVDYLHGVDQLDIQVGNLATERGTPAMRQFGATLVTDQTSADRRIVAYAHAHGAPAVPSETPTDLDHRPLTDALDRLAALRGRDFDDELLDVMPDAEEAEAETIENSLETIEDPELEQILRGVLAMLKAHVVAIHTLATTLP